MKQINSPDAKRIKNKTKLEEHLYLSRADYDSKSPGMTGFVCQAHALFRKQVTEYNQLVHALSCFVLLSYHSIQGYNEMSVSIMYHLPENHAKCFTHIISITSSPAPPNT